MTWKTPVFTAAALAGSLAILWAADDAETWIDPDLAAAEHPDFNIQGEYVAEDAALQAAAINDGNFLVTRYAVGLPGDGWDGGDLKPEIMDRAALEAAIEGMERVVRESPTLGQMPPEGATVIFAGEANQHVEGDVQDGLLFPPGQTKVKTGDFRMHLEFRMPFKPSRTPSSQDRGNSGIYIFNNYECQVLDTFALDLNSANNPVKLGSNSDRWCAALYQFKPADLQMAFPPLQWQTYDIEFTAPRFDANGEKTENARLTLLHNGVTVHDDVELPKGTGAGGGRPEKAEDFVYFQGHGNPVAFRNIWMIPGDS